MSTHTKGPWKARHKPNYRGIDDIWCVDWSEDQEEVVEICHGEANARLIAAAPELLEALEKLLNEIDGEAMQSVGCAKAELMFEHAAVARAAIAKAKGGGL